MGQFLTTGGALDPFLPRLLEAIRRADRIDLAAAFIKSSGLALVYPVLVDAVETRGAQLRLLTSGYLDVTDPEALRRLMLLAERAASRGLGYRRVLVVMATGLGKTYRAAFNSQRMQAARSRQAA